MTQVTFKGNKITLTGQLPSVGSQAPDFWLTNGSLEEVSLQSYAGKRKVLTINPSYDTPVCATAAKTFNTKAAAATNTVVLAISADLPFAQQRFCTTENVQGAHALSCFRSREFAEKYGVWIGEGPLKGLTARAVVVLDENNVVLHSELVAEMTNEPNYEAALAVLTK